MSNGENKPISAWGYLGYELLFTIPIVGIIIAIILALGAHNQNVKNFARSQFCYILVVAVLVFVCTLLGIDVTL